MSEDVSGRHGHLERVLVGLWLAFDAGTESRAQLAREIRAVIRELDEVAVPVSGSKVDELRNRRAARGVDPSDIASSSRRSQSRRSNGNNRSG